VLRWRYDT